MHNHFPVKVMLEDIRSALNVGAIFRTADAANIQELILAGITPYPPHNRIPKTALGAIETVPWKHIKHKGEALDYAQQYGELIAVELTEDAVDFWSYKFPTNCCLIFGNEITGVSAEAIERATTTVKIPMYGHKESLNIATSFGIVIYELLRQWQS